MRKVVVVGGARIPNSPAHQQFARFWHAELGSLALVEALFRAGVRPDRLGEVVLGCAMPPPASPNVARDVALRAQLPPVVVTSTVSQGAASGMLAVLEACYRIAAGDAEVVAAGGLESASKSALPPKAGAGKGGRASVADLANAGEGSETGTLGQAAENLAATFGITRKEQDEGAALSRDRAEAAAKRGRLREEIVSVPLPPTYEKWLQEDVGIGQAARLESLARMEPVVDRDYGTVTAGNSAHLADGACCLVLAEEEWARAEGLKALGEIRGFAAAGVEPDRFGLAPAVAVCRLLDRASMSLQDVHLVEMAELFSAQLLACGRALESDSWCTASAGRPAAGALDPAKTNVNGGGIAFGHAQGAEGSRLILTLLYELAARDSGTGVAATCAAGGLGTAVLLERR